MGVTGATVIPALALFNVDDSLQLMNQTLSWTYCGLSFIYASLFCAGMLLLGLASFARQDIP